MAEQRRSKNAKLLAAGAAACLILSGCSPKQIDEERKQPAVIVSRGAITASLNRYIESGSSEPFEQFSFTGMFARYDLEDSLVVESLLNKGPQGVDLSLDTCTLPAPVIDEYGQRDFNGATSIELLDAGDLSVSFGGARKAVPTRTFPDLLKVIVGVIYTADETQGVAFQPGEIYNLHATGSDEIAQFDTVLEAPEDLGEIKVNGATLDEETPLIDRGRELDISWEGDEYGDEVVAVLSWISMGSPWSIVCRLKDDGLFAVPAQITAGLPDPINSSDEELTLSRIRQVTFRSNGLSTGTFRFVISTNFPVKF